MPRAATRTTRSAPPAAPFSRFPEQPTIAVDDLGPVRVDVRAERNRVRAPAPRPRLRSRRRRRVGALGQRALGDHAGRARSALAPRRAAAARARLRRAACRRTRRLRARRTSGPSSLYAAPTIRKTSACASSRTRCVFWAATSCGRSKAPARTATSSGFAAAPRTSGSFSPGAWSAAEARRRITPGTSRRRLRSAPASRSGARRGSLRSCSS